MSFQISDNIRYQFKIILVGDGGVGKTCLTNRFCYSEFLDTKLTIGLSFNNYSLPAKEKGEKIGVGLSIWDFGGQERFRPLLSQFILGANGVIYVYDMTAFHSLVHLVETWLPLVQANTELIPSILVGAKYDIVNPDLKFDDGVVDEVRCKIGAVKAFETSAKTGYNTEIIFKAIVQLILDEPPYNKRGIQLL
ncbi:MAG: hypothetical protein DRO88_12560 [Promethearchaeia archaeon]|nr:MAG: hypothetical protein DRO88_12560 [Candidatus Lokiarchaeia archaeon]